MRKFLKTINLAFAILILLVSIIFISIEIYNIASLNFFLYEHPFNGLIRFFARFITFAFYLVFSILVIINTFKTNDIKKIIVMYTSFGCILLSIYYFFYVDLYVALFYLIISTLISVLHFFTYYFLEDKEKYTKFLKRKQTKKEKNKEKSTNN